VEHDTTQGAMTHNRLSRDLPQSFSPAGERLVQKGLDDCSHCGRRRPPLERRLATIPDEPIGSS
jgi:hypothetical protein